MSYDLIYNSNKINSLRIVYDTERLKYVRPLISRSNVFKGLEGAQCRFDQDVFLNDDFGLDHGIGHLASMNPEKNERLTPRKD